MAESRDRFTGMTVNERLVVAGLVDEFDSAAHARDRVRLCAVLRRVAFSAEEAESIADSVLGNPARYGY